LKEAVVGLRFEKALKDADYASFKNFGRNDIRLASAIAEVESERNQELMEDALDIIIGFKIHY